MGAFCGIVVEYHILKQPRPPGVLSFVIFWFPLTLPNSEMACCINISPSIHIQDRPFKFSKANPLFHPASNSNACYMFPHFLKFVIPEKRACSHKDTCFCISKSSLFSRAWTMDLNDYFLYYNSTHSPSGPTMLDTVHMHGKR